ncbi:MAG: hypothetical protein GY811_03065, partial [Myxococcales bacterium]|nr:hypothetical protein [Myxococcales bacterium]
MNRVSKRRRKALTEIIPLPISLEDLVHEELREFVIVQGMVALQNVLE